MFSYFGGKRTTIHLYPKPRCPLVVEPFAGSASYAYFHFWDHKIWINDIDYGIYRLWRYLRAASWAEIMNLPAVEYGFDVRAEKWLLREEQDLILFNANPNRAQPGIRVSSWGNVRWRKDQPRIASNLWRVRDWKITNLHYSEMPNVEATWFVDAPYQNYKWGSYTKNEKQIDYDHLADWCRSRKGQVIVCENVEADWLPFRSLGPHPWRKHNLPFQGRKKPDDTTYAEAVWTND